MGFWDGSRISWTICKQSAPRSRQITTTTPHHSIFTGRLLFLTPDQQCRSTEGTECGANNETRRVRTVSIEQRTNCWQLQQPTKTIDRLGRVESFKFTRLVSVGWLDSRVVSVLDSGAVGPGFKSQPRRCRVTV